MTTKHTPGPHYVIHWPHEGAPTAPSSRGGFDEKDRSFTPWLERVEDGVEIFCGGVGDGHEPEDMCLGRDLNVLVDELNRVAELAAQRAEAFRLLEDACDALDAVGRPFVRARAAIAKARGQS